MTLIKNASLVMSNRQPQNQERHEERRILSDTICHACKRKARTCVQIARVVLGIEPGIGLLQYIFGHWRPYKDATNVCKYSKKSQKSRADIRLPLDPIGPIVFGPEPGIGFSQYIFGTLCSSMSISSRTAHLTGTCKYSKKSKNSRADDRLFWFR